MLISAQSDDWMFFKADMLPEGFIDYYAAPSENGKMIHSPNLQNFGFSMSDDYAYSLYAFPAYEIKDMKVSQDFKSMAIKKVSYSLDEPDKFNVHKLVDQSIRKTG